MYGWRHYNTCCFEVGDDDDDDDGDCDGDDDDDDNVDDNDDDDVLVTIYNPLENN